jgi:hypothetical protein
VRASSPIRPVSQQPKGRCSPDASVLHLRPPTRSPPTPSPAIRPPNEELIHGAALAGSPATNLSRCGAFINARAKENRPNWAGSAWPRTHLRLGSDRLRRSTKRHPPVTRSRPIRRVSAFADGGRL